MRELGDMVHGLSSEGGEGTRRDFQLEGQRPHETFTSVQGKWPGGVGAGVPSSLEARDGQGCQALWGY